MRERVCDAVTKSAYQLGRELKGSISMPPLPLCLPGTPTTHHAPLECRAPFVFYNIYMYKRWEAKAKAAEARWTRTTNTWMRSKWASQRWTLRRTMRICGGRSRLSECLLIEKKRCIRCRCVFGRQSGQLGFVLLQKRDGRAHVRFVNFDSAKWTASLEIIGKPGPIGKIV